MSRIRLSRSRSRHRRAHRVRIGSAGRDGSSYCGRRRRRADRAEDPPGRNRSKVRVRGAGQVKHESLAQPRDARPKYQHNELD
jgi:hypothetical protein